MNLVIVESPTKAKTISKFLGKDYQVESSFGHIMDLPKSTLGVDTENNYQPKYIVPAKAKKQVNRLIELAKKADGVILATDEDREGEAIAWHLTQALSLGNSKSQITNNKKILNSKSKIPNRSYQRIAFHEITKSAIEKALQNPRTLDMNLVNAQQARRVLDRLVGYKLSPFLWKKIARGLSAGRVQSVAVRLIVEREEEIKNFKTQEYWTIKAAFTTQAGKNFEAELAKIENRALKKFDIGNEEQAREIKSKLEKCAYKILDIEKKQTSKSPLPPFTTATLQQTANARLGFSAKQTMTVAQKLYETGLITYMRTDSVNLSGQFSEGARNFIKKTYGDKYLPAAARVYKTKSKNAQEAHEAIRPTDPEMLAENLPDGLDSGQKKLYQLIWQRALATQAAPAMLDNTIIEIDAERFPKPSKVSETLTYQLRATGQIITFDGYLKIYPQTTKENILPDVDKNTKINLDEIIPEQHLTEPPARYSDATLVKALEKYGIGRPSTYAPTISTIIARNYAERDDKKRLAPTDIAFVVNKLLVSHFPEIVDYKFTADMEEELDHIAEGKIKWQKTIDKFYQPFIKNLTDKEREVSKKELTEEATDEKCDQCGSPMIIKMGRFGKFLACSNFPDCKNTKQFTGGDKDRDGRKDSEELKKFAKKYEGIKCAKCGSDMVAKIGKYGPFIACSNYPKCKNILDTNGTGIACPQCGKGEITKKRGRRGIFYACNQYPDCKFALWGKPTGGKCEKCGSLMVESKDGIKCSNKDCK
ncbi:type I DNA topoisomerase [Candidatus Falkowbacteria bacterium CG10_big_fil_rev_8_21_14_0_10_43_10]|uniref:DNA topoisomerase 1 n=1 Tax=Candidatus Falkowbacteria bacterium CG10_big_fil_rev_8_21_14_0_10_43_10 TaxID=1974567 RepID=A0A2H0V1X4_9BACT|nr:MAG: type I DNA topoisomerase [Candidatus Falkowbacteria bacterium CG10_big_fil_rev_8_21_14_0_10_43_10]